MARPSFGLGSPATGKIVSYRNSLFFLGVIIVSGLVLLGYVIHSLFLPGSGDKSGLASQSEPSAQTEDGQDRPVYTKVLNARLKAGEWSEWLNGRKHPPPPGYKQTWRLDWELSGGEVEVEFQDGYRNIFNCNQEDMDFGVRYPVVRLKARQNGTATLTLNFHKR